MFRNLCCRYYSDYSNGNTNKEELPKKEKQEWEEEVGGNQGEKNRVKDNIWEMEREEAEHI